MADKEFAKIEQEYIKELKRIARSNAKLLKEVQMLKEQVSNKQDKSCEHLYTFEDLKSGSFMSCTKCGQMTYDSRYAELKAKYG